jgi:hypothetical protein
MKLYNEKNKKICLECCKQSICSTCFNHLIKDNLHCPNCRGDLSNTQSNLGDLISNIYISNASSFDFQFRNLLQTIKNKTIIVYYRPTLDDLSMNVVKNIGNYLKRPPLVIKGNSQCIKITMNKFKNDINENFLLVNAYFFNYGLNLQFVENLIIVNQIDDDNISQQIDGRLLRYGRLRPLNKYNFEEITQI